MSERFLAKMQNDSDESSRASDRNSGASAGSAARNSDGGKFDSLSGESGHQQDGQLARADIALRLAGKEVQAVATQSPLGAGHQAELDRMAAQIAESWPSAKASEFEIKFPDGALAQAAHMKREADGAMAIRIAGLDPRLNSLHAGYAQFALMQALARRRFKIASLVFERANNDQRGRLSDMPRAV